MLRAADIRLQNFHIYGSIVLHNQHEPEAVKDTYQNWLYLIKDIFIHYSAIHNTKV